MGHSLMRFGVITLLAGSGWFGLAVAAQRQSAPAGQRANQPTQFDWLVVSSLDMTPTIISKSGVGTANAVAEARLTRKDAEGWCANQGAGIDVGKCVREQLASEDFKKTYRATADCTQGRIVTTDGQTHTLAGVWDSSDIGGGRTKWRDASGQIVGRDNASGGLGISQQWEVLCPGPLKVGVPGSNAAARPLTQAASNRAPTPGQVRNPAAGQPARPARKNPAVCAGVQFCEEVNDFAVTITDFRASLNQATKVLTATMGFRNKSDHPITLGYIPGSGVGTDERGNRYAANDGDVRGIGLISGRGVDDKFVLQPGQESDARFTYLWGAGREIFGTTFEIELTVREIIPLENNQLKLGAESPLRFTGLTHRSITVPVSKATAPVNPPASGSQPQPSAVAPPQADHCEGSKQPCYDAGPFTATLVGLTAAMANFRHHSVRMTIAFKNWTDQQLILGYKNASNSMTDNLSNAYYWGRAGTYDNSVQGIGIVLPGRSSDSKFRLAPGQSSNATFGMIRYEAGNRPKGTAFTLDTVIIELRILPNGQQTEIVREYSVHLPDLTAGGGAGAPSVDSITEAGKKIRGIFQKKK